MASVNQLLLDESISHQVDLRRYEAGLVQRMIAVLNRSDARLFAELTSALQRLDPASFTVERLESMLSSVRTINAQAYAQVAGDLDIELRKFTAYELAYQQSVLVSFLPIEVSVATVTAESVYAGALARPFQGGLLKGFLSDLEATKAKKIRQAVAQGFVESKTTDQIVRELRGTRAKGYADGLLEITRRDAQAVVRTALSHMAGFVQDRTTAANVDIIKAVIWHSTIDVRTSAPCIARDLKQYTPDTHKPIGHSLPWGQGPGRFHWNSVVRGSLITTGRGLVPVESVVVGDLVLTHKGCYKPVTALFSKQCDSGVVRVVYTKSGRILRATDDHPVLTVGSGWKFVGALELGDQLFSNSEGFETISLIDGEIYAESKDCPTSIDDRLVALHRTVQLVSATINFKGDFEVWPSEIENSASDLILGDPERIKGDQCAQHHLLALGQILSECGRNRLRQILSCLLTHGNTAHPVAVTGIGSDAYVGCFDAISNTVHSGRVVGDHSAGVLGVSDRGFFGLSEGPMIRSFRSGDSPSGEVNVNLLGFVTDRDAMLLGVIGEASIGKAHVPLDFSEGVSGNDVKLRNEHAVIGCGFVHDPIIALKVQTFNDYVYDLAVADDCSYVASGIVVSNCRSAQAYVLKSNKELGIDAPEVVMTDGTRASMDGQVPKETNYAEWLAKQSASRQDDVLGPTRGAMLRKGDLSVAQMFDSKGNFLTLEQLAKR